MKNKNYLIGIFCFILFASIFALNFLDKLEILKSEPLNPSDKIKQFNSLKALDFAKRVCELGPRYGGNEAELKAANIMENKLKKYGLSLHKEKVTLGDGKYTYNVVGEIRGSRNPERCIIIGSQ
jgi:aminopeptidase YwaD